MCFSTCQSVHQIGCSHDGVIWLQYILLQSLYCRCVMHKLFFTKKKYWIQYLASKHSGSCSQIRSSCECPIMTGSLAGGLFSSNFCSGFVRDTFFSLHHWRGGFIRMPVQLSLTVKCEHYHECSERCIFCLILRVTTRLLHKIILKIVMLWLAMSWTLPEFEKRELNFRMNPTLW